MIDINKNLVKLLQESLNNEEIFLFHGPFSPNLMWVHWSCQDVSDRYRVKLPMYAVLDGKECTVLTSLIRYQSFSKKIFFEYWRDCVTIDELKQDHAKRYQYIDDFYTTYTKKHVATLDDETLRKSTDELRRNFTKLAAETIFIEQFDRAIALSIIGEDKKEWLENIWEKSTDSHFESFDTRRNKYILSILNQTTTQNAVENLAYIYTDYWQPKSCEEIQQILEDINIAQIQKETTIHEIEMNKKETLFNQWYETLDQDQKKFTDYVQYIMYARDIRKDPIAKVQYVLYLFAQEALKRIDLDLSYSYLITPMDIVLGIDNLRDIKEEIIKRKNGVEIFMDEEGGHVIQLCNPKDIYKELKEKIPGYAVDTQDTIIGQIASKGNVTGIIRVVMDPHTTIFQDGEILVTSMTRPEFVPIMKKAGAVITNEGGITCHAAIVSRELKIPCIIGTKFATQILKDGDMVEVDADNGVVRIISRA